MFHRFMVSLCLNFCILANGFSQDLVPERPSRIVPVPADTSLWKEWKDQLSRVREKEKNSIHYNDSLYRSKDFYWTSSCFNVCMLMLFDKRFYDEEAGKFKVDAFVKDATENFGGYDGVVLWHAYPRIGFDERNQFDFYREFPGGTNGLKEIVKQFHAYGIKVFIDYNPWDTGTRREGKPDIDVLADIITAIEADGLFLDTMDGSTEDFLYKINRSRKGTILESELEVPVERINYHHMSWAQGYEDSYIPGVLWNKWFERRHMLHVTKRWETDHTPELHTAWMNGCGMIIWDNIFGACNLYNERDKSIFRSMAPIQRQFSEIFSGGERDPLCRISLPGVFAAKWNNEKYTLWTLVNRNEDDRSGLLFRARHSPGIKYFDLVQGRETGTVQNDTVNVNGFLHARGAGAILAVKTEDIDPVFTAFLRSQAAIYSGYNNDNSPKYPDEKRVAPPFVNYARERLPEGMIYIPKNSHQTTIRFRQRECGFYHVPGEEWPVLANQKWFSEIVRKSEVNLEDYAIDETPVTNQQFYEFMQATHYKPASPDKFLAHWVNGRPEKGRENHPVTYVNPDDARAYARWAGKRLPTEEEWQYAAQGPEQNAYPWGNTFNADYCNNGQFQGTTPVKQFEKGRSAFGCYDMCGNTWEWTESERTDQLTRFCILKGGSYYKAEGSHWYTDGKAQRADFSAKFILMNPGLDRCSTIGFRCAASVRP